MNTLEKFVVKNWAVNHYDGLIAVIKEDETVVVIKANGIKVFAGHAKDILSLAREESSN